MNTQAIELNSTCDQQALLRGRIKQAWRVHASTRTGTAAQHAARALLLGRPLDRAFTPITNVVKLANGMDPHHGRNQALLQAVSGEASVWQPFAHLLEGATIKEQWGRRYYDMASHPLLKQAAEAAARVRS